MVTTWKLRSVAAWSALTVVGFASIPLAPAATIGYTLLDHDFSLESPYKSEAVFATNGTAADTLTVNPNGVPSINTGSTAPYSDVPSYTYYGTLPDVANVMDPTANPDGNQTFVVYGTKGKTKYTISGSMSLTMSFTGSDGPFTAPGGAQEVSLTGAGPTAGRMVITGLLSVDGSTPASNVPQQTLLDITFSDVSLVATVGQTNAHVTAVGHINELLNVLDPTSTAGFDPSDVGIMDFVVQTPTAFFTDPNYTPSKAVSQTNTGTVSGQALVGQEVPEPATIALLLGAGTLGLGARRRRRT